VFTGVQNDARVYGPWTRLVNTGVKKMIPVSTAREHGRHFGHRVVLTPVWTQIVCF